MLMGALHRHADTEVFDEHQNSRAFSRVHLRSNRIISDLISRSRFDFVCFKPISESFRIREFREQFVGCHCVWLYRRYADVANSSLRRFGDPAPAIKMACVNKGTGWLQDGMYPEIIRTLREVYHPALSDFDFSCLAWWTRNQILFETGLQAADRVTVLKYEELVTNPEQAFSWLLGRLGMPSDERPIQKISARFIGKHPSPAVDETVRQLCDSTLTRLDQVFYASYNAEPPQLHRSTESDSNATDTIHSG